MVSFFAIANAHHSTQAHKQSKTQRKVPVPSASATSTSTSTSTSYLRHSQPASMSGPEYSKVDHSSQSNVTQARTTHISLQWEVDFDSRTIQGSAKHIVQVDRATGKFVVDGRSEEHTSELQSLMSNSYAVFCLEKKKQDIH